VQAASVQTEARDARIDVDNVCHNALNIAPHGTVAIAAKARTSPDGAQLLAFARDRNLSGDRRSQYR
jgi:hypothetical protein